MHFFFQGSNDPIYDCLAMKLFIEVELNQTSYWDPNYDDSITDVQGRFLDGVVAWFREMGQFATTVLWHLEILEVSWPMDLRSPIRRKKTCFWKIFLLQNLPDSSWFYSVFLLVEQSSEVCLLFHFIVFTLATFFAVYTRSKTKADSRNNDNTRCFYHRYFVDFMCKHIFANMLLFFQDTFSIQIFG